MEQRRMLRAVIVGSALLAAACGRTGLLGEGESVGGSGSGSGGAAGGRGGGGGLSGVSGNDVGGGSPATGGAAGDGGSAGAPMSSPLRIGPELLPDARVRWDYRTTLTARGGAGAPYTFTLVGVPLPPGLALASANGWLAGIPTRVGDYPVRVQVRDAAGAMATRDYVLRVVPPRFLAVYTFVSSSSSRTAINLVDLIRPDLPMYTVADGSLSNNAFSPDGRWLAYCDHVQHMGQGQLFLVDTTGDKPGPPLPVLEAGETSECTAWAWSPDSQQLAYVREGTLFIADVRETGVFERTERVQGVSRLGLRWVAPDLIFLRDEQGRARLLELDPPVGAIKSVNLEPSTLLSASPNRELVFGSTGSGYFLADATTGNAEELGPWSAWNVSPTFELLVGRSAMGEFALYSPSQATLPAPLRVGTGALGRSAAFGRVRPALLQREHDHLVMSELRAGALEVQPVSGAYGAPTGFGFDSEDEVVVLTDRDSLWLSDTTAAGPLTAHAASQVGRDPAFQLASSSRQLVAAGGDPYAVQLIEFRDPKKPVVSPVNVDLLWSELGWSPDDTHLALYGGSSSLGRPLYVVTADRPGAAKVVVSCSGNGGSVPRCPGGFKFQP